MKKIEVIVNFLAYVWEWFLQQAEDVKAVLQMAWAPLVESTYARGLVSVVASGVVIAAALGTVVVLIYFGRKYNWDADLCIGFSVFLVAVTIAAFIVGCAWLPDVLAPEGMTIREVGARILRR